MSKKTKIICTIGPASESKEVLTKLVEAGMNIARLNFSHGDYEEHAERVKRIREVSKETGKPIGILLDTKGPEIRLGDFENGGCDFVEGDEIDLVKEEVLGNHERFTLRCPEVFNDVKVGDYILMDDGKMKVTTMEGATQYVSQGPTAAIVPIKQLGTNGGGYFGVNSSHPLENPTYFANMVECWSILIIPMAMAFAFGFYLKRKKLGYSIYGVMLFAYLVGVCINVSQEMGGNPRIDEMGIAQDNGAMEGKEIRLGSAATALWSITTTVTSNGSVNGMHDSTMPLSGMMEMLNMQINTWFGGVGVGWMNYFTFIIIAVFISGLMVGRTPEFLGHKVEAREMKIASIVALLHPFIILVGTALAAYLFVHAPAFVESEGGWLNNPGYHGLSEMLYEYTSCAANNGSGFEGLGDNTWFWNYSCGIVLILGRFVPIVGQVAIAGILAKKKFIPESAGTLQTDTVTFGVMTFAVIFIVAALSFFPVHALSTIAEHLSL